MCVCAGVCVRARVDMLVQGGSVSYAQEWAVGANITGVWLPRDHRAPLFSTLSRIIRVRAQAASSAARA